MTEQPKLFDLPPARLKMPPGPIVRHAEIDGDCRWTLRRAWGPGPSILWCGCNPSTADGEKDDPTILREIGFSFRWGFGSLVKVNLYPFITPHPRELRRRMREDDAYDLMEANSLRLKDEARKVDARVAAWGAILKPFEVEQALWDIFYKGEDVTEFEWQCLGTTESGAPKHTLARGKHRIPDDAKLEHWPFEFSGNGCGG